MILGISGKAGAGKDTIYRMVVYTIYYWRHYNKMKKAGYIKFEEDYSLKHMQDFENTFKDIHVGIYKHSFAFYLKSALAIICDCDVEDFENIDFKNSKVPWLDLTYRELLQKFGTAIRNEVCDDFWVKTAFKDDNLKDSYIHVFTDVRFKSEAKSIKNRDGILIRINRKEAGAGNHISETELDDYQFDYVIDNNSSMEDLLFKVKEFCINYKLI